MPDIDKFMSRFSGLTEEYRFYDGQVVLHYEPEAHVYLLVTPDGLIPQDGATGTCGIIDKSDALVPWGCKMMALKLFATTPTVYIGGEKYVPLMKLADYEKLVIDAKKAHKERLEDAANIGKIAHNWIEKSIKEAIAAGHGVCSKLPILGTLPQNEKSAFCCVAAIEWMDRHNVRWICTEKKVYSRRYRFAGTMDGLCIVDSCNNPDCCPVPFKDRRSVADWKTSNALHIEYIMQTACYEQAEEEESGIPIDDRWIIRLGKEDGAFDPWHLQAEDFPRHFSAFLNALELTRDVSFIKNQMASRDRIIKDQKKAVAKAEREAALKISCPKSGTYGGTRRTKGCNGTDQPCETCLKTYEQFQALKKPKVKQKKIVDVHESGMKAYELMFLASLNKPGLMLTDGSDKLSK